MDELKKELYGDLMYIYKTLYSRIRYRKDMREEEIFKKLLELKANTEKIFDFIYEYGE